MNQKNRARRLAIAAIAILAPTLAAGCMHHSVRVEPVTIAPMRVTMDVNLRVDDARQASAADPAAGDGQPAGAAAGGGASAAGGAATATTAASE